MKDCEAPYSICKSERGWLVREYPGQRHRKCFASKRAATAYVQHLLRQQAMLATALDRTLERAAEVPQGLKWLLPQQAGEQAQA